MDSHLTPLSWLGTFLEKRGCQDSKPDGRPLYAYQCTEEEYQSLTEILIKAEKFDAVTNKHSGYALSTGYLFTFYCAEWWRRNYSGGPWKWAPIIDSLKWKHSEYKQYTEYVAKGLRFWKRDLIRTNSGTQYLLSAASEGGIPINVLEREGAAFSHYLKSLIRDYGRYSGSGLSEEQIASDNLYRLPVSWRQPQIASLAGQIIVQIWELKSQIGSSSNPVKRLNDSVPGWQNQFPLMLGSDQAETLVNSLLKTARDVASKRGKTLKLERLLMEDLDGWSMSARILFPSEMSVDLIKNMCALPSAMSLPDRIEMYRVVGDERVLVARITGEGDTRYVRPTPGATRPYKTNVTVDQSVALVSRGQEIASVSVVGGDALDNEMPWCFVTADEEQSIYKWVAQGGCNRREPIIYVLSDRPPVDESSHKSAEKICDGVYDKSLWKVERVSIIDHGDTDGVYRISPSLENVSSSEYSIIGHRAYFPITRFPLYKSFPSIRILSNEDLSKSVGEAELKWRPIGQQVWRKYHCQSMIGDIEVRHIQDGVILAAWKLSVLPEKAGIEVQPKNRLEGDIHFNFPQAKAVGIEEVNGLSVSLNKKDGVWSYSCTRQDISTGILKGHIAWEDSREVSMSLPFPAQGASFVDKDGREVSDKNYISVPNLYGYRAQVVRSKNHEKYELLGSLYSKSGSKIATKLHSFKYDLSFDEYGISSFPIQQLYSEIEQIFSISTGVDDKVILKIKKTRETKSECAIEVHQYIGALEYTRERRLIYYKGESEAIGMLDEVKLNLISISDFENENIELSWNSESYGWQVPDYGEIDLASTYFAVICGVNSQKVRPCIIPNELSHSDYYPTKLSELLSYSKLEERLDGLSEYFSELSDSGHEDEWRELCSCLKSLSCMHPDSLDIVEVMISNPYVMASLWFRAFADQQLMTYLEEICEASPFKWWMISINVWVKALKAWRDNYLIDIDNEQVVNIVIRECKSSLERLQSENEEMDASIGLMLEDLGEELGDGSAILMARGRRPENVWSQIDMLSRGYFIPSKEGDDWPSINQIFSLKNKISDEISRCIAWPIENMDSSYKSVIYAPLVLAAALESNIDIDEEMRIAFLAARNFHPSAFATIFRMTQATLSQNQEPLT